MKAINVTKIILTATLVVSYCFNITNSYSFSILNGQKDDTLYILYENEDWNKIDLSKKPTKSYNYERGYPCDWDRKYNIISGKYVHIWFYYFNNLPEWSDMVFDFKQIDRQFVENHDFKDQNWYRSNSKEDILHLFLDKDKVIYLVEKDRIENGKAIMIRVYPDVQAVE